MITLRKVDDFPLYDMLAVVMGQRYGRVLRFSV